MTCSFEGCEKPAAPRGRYCWAHYKQLAKGKLKPIRPYQRDKTEALKEATFRFTETDSDDETSWLAAWNRFKAAVHYYRRRKKPRA